MIRLRFKKKGSSVKAFRVRMALRDHSEKKSISLNKSKFKPKQLQKPSPGKELNAQGNKRGLHNRENPPSSEQMKMKRAMRRFYNKAMPELQCSTCQFANTCPQFRAGYKCAFLPFLNSHRVENEEDLIFYMRELLGANMRRTHQLLLMETLTGGRPSLETSEALSLAFQQLTKLHEIANEKDETSLTIEGDAGTIIGGLFGGLSTLLKETRQARSNPIIIEPPLQKEKEKTIIDVPVDNDHDQGLIDSFIKGPAHNNPQLDAVARLAQSVMKP